MPADLSDGVFGEGGAVWLLLLGFKAIRYIGRESVSKWLYWH